MESCKVADAVSKWNFEVGTGVWKRQGKKDGLWGYVDSDYARDLDRRRSLTGYVFMLNGCVVNWKAILQHVVALSIIEAEYIYATEAVKKALWLKGLIYELGVA